MKKNLPLFLVSSLLALLFCWEAEAVIKTWSVKEGNSIVLRFKEIERIAIGNPQIADATVVSPDEVLVNGEKEGVTSLHVWTKGGLFSYQIRVLKEEEPTLLEGLSQIEGFESVKIVRIGDLVILKGEVGSKEDKEKAEEIAAALGKKVVNLLKVRPMAKGKEAPVVKVSQMKGLEGVQTVFAGETVILSGAVDNQHDKIRAEEIAKSLYPDKKVMNLVETENPVQVMVRLELIEVNRAAFDEMGIDWMAEYGKGDYTYQAGFASSIIGIPSAVMSGAKISKVSSKNLKLLEADLSFYEKRGVLRVLSSPRLIALSGKEAYTNMGGKIPVPVDQGNGKITVDWVDYGIGLKITPLVDTRENINLKIESTVSQPDWGNKVGVYPAVREKKVTTEVNLKNKETIVISGLVNRTEGISRAKVPFLSDLPIIGPLFTGEANQEGDEELIVLITPQIVASEEIKTLQEMFSKKEGPFDEETGRAYKLKKEEAPRFPILLEEELKEGKENE
ncbi:pilus assembly protein N-terminal domain-containing protein [bacterium]|nr:pilus assembly protein N-terminal domain-containing protein [bacterium]